MFLHSLFFPNYLPLSDFSVLEKYTFAGNPWFPCEPSFHVNSNNNLINNINNDLIQEKKEPGKLEEKPIEIKIEKEQEKEKKEPEKKKPETNSLFHVKHVQDELFWLVFVAIYGETEYYRNKYNYGKVEIQEKQKIAEKIQDPVFGKKMKWKWTKIQKIEMISDLTNRPQMPIAIMNVLAVYYECTFILVDSTKKVYLNYGSTVAASPSEEEKIYIIYVTSKTGKNGKEKKEYTLDMQPSLDTLQKIQEEYFALEHYERPLKAISNYKKIELDAISCKLGVGTVSAEGKVSAEGTEGEKTSKNEVYDRLRLFLADSAILFLQE